MQSPCGNKMPSLWAAMRVGIHLLIKLGGRGGEGVDEESDREEDEQPIKDDEQEAASRRRKDDTLHARVRWRVHERALKQARVPSFRGGWARLHLLPQRHRLAQVCLRLRGRTPSLSTVGRVRPRG